jgi:hypothetical protein
MRNPDATCILREKRPQPQAVSPASVVSRMVQSVPSGSLRLKLNPPFAMNTTSDTTVAAKDLTQEPPRSPRERLGGYAILARCLDKGRAELNHTAGEFHFNCPLDNMLFSFKGVDGADIRKLLEQGASDQEVVKWLNTHGITRTPEDVAAWSAAMDEVQPYKDQEKKSWFIGECEKVGLDPASTTLFEYLETDDRLMPAGV